MDHDDAHASFSPNGSKIAFTSRRDRQQQIFVMNADDSNVTHLTFTNEPNIRPTDLCIGS
ncbi:MAG: PD40 domain-containing protein [Chloroflexi bacterium]|nr:PD40 domain-containing protein [Chloroflexota bacterium]